MRKHTWHMVILIAALLCSCNHKTSSTNTTDNSNSVQDILLKAGWTSEQPNGGELSEEYGVKPILGIQDNYFDIHIGKGFSVAIKIVNANSNKCIRYVFVPEGETITVTQIPQGRYYLKLAYGKDWMEFADGNSIKGKFSSSPFFERSTSSYDFGKKNSQSFVNYSLELNVINGDLEHNFETIKISEAEFDRN